YSIRASTIKVCCVILLFAVILTGLVLSGRDGVVSASSSVTEVDFSGIKTKDDRIEFISDFGIKVDPDSENEVAFRMPESFDRVILGYNELQKKQGLDLSKYHNKRVTRYTYKVTNYDSDGEVYANLFVYRGKIVACDLSSADPSGFVVPLTLAKDNLK
ncbi:MAG: DUF4830 domain-containing protein, partial [Clostridia bacterium]|nr:DUF4830 domain-containing protein [Clostridia bacterium]